MSADKLRYQMKNKPKGRPKEDVPLDALPPTLDAFLVKMCMEHPNATAADIAEYAEQYNKKISERIEKLNHKLEEL